MSKLRALIVLPLRTVPDDQHFEPLANYKQPLRSYLKQCGCLASSRKYLVCAFKTMIHVWRLEDSRMQIPMRGWQTAASKILASWRGHSQLIGQLEVRKNLLGENVNLDLSVKMLNIYSIPLKALLSSALSSVLRV